MDSLTQAALGAVVGERVIGRSLGRRAMLWGAVVGTLPDLDILAYPFLDPPGQLYWHRGLSHSLLGMLVGAPLLAWLLWLWWQRRGLHRQRDGFPPTFGRVLFFTGLNFATHVLIDCFTVYGTQLFDPVSRARIGTNNLFIIDPLFTLPLFLWLGGALLAGHPPGVARRGWVGFCGCLLGVYIAASFVFQARATQRFHSELSRLGIEPMRGEVSATPFNIVVWRGLFETQDAFWIGHWSLSDDEQPQEFFRVPRNLDALEPLRGDRVIDSVRWFSEDYLLVEPAGPRGGWVVTDLRFVEFWPETTPGKPRTFFTWWLKPPDPSGPADWELVREDSQYPGFGVLWERIRARWAGDRGAMGPSR